jgi:choice-of-anchor A domain-containing protein
MYKFLFSLAMLTLGLLVNTTTHAAVLTATELLGGFNAIIFGNATTSADIEGASIIGGNFSGATAYNNPKGVAIPNTFNALNVFGNTSGNPINLNNGGNAYVGGTKGAIVNFNGGGQYVASSPVMGIADIKAELLNFSLYLSGLQANSYLPTPDNNEIIVASPNASGLAVFNITVDDLSKIPSYSIDLNGATTVIFNVSGSILDFKANYQGNDSIFDNIIWNFYDATNITFETLIGGSVLAPYASVTNKNQIDGTLVANTWTGQGELHEYAFDGSVPRPTPEPSSMLLFASGVLLFGFWRRRGAR